MKYTQKNNLDDLYEEEEINNRAATLAPSGGPSLPTTSRTPAKEGPAVSDKQSAVELWTPQHVAFLDQHIFLGESAKIEETFDFINEQLADFSGGFKNFRVFPEEFKTVGYFLDETREGCYRIQMFTFNDKLGVNCTRLNGDSLALCSLWKNLKQSLHDNEFYVDKFLVDGDMDDDDIFGDEEDDFDMSSFKYLDFSRDEAFVSKLVSDVTDLNVGTHAMMLLKFNMEKESNQQLVLEKFAQDLFDKSADRLAGHNVTLPDAVCAAHILYHLVTQAAITMTFEKLNSIIEAVEQWCAEDRTTSTIVPTASEEAALKLTELFPEVLEQISEELKTELEFEDRLKRIVESSDFDSVKDAGRSLMSSN